MTEVCAKRKSLRIVGCVIPDLHFLAIGIFWCNIIFVPKMAKLQLGVGTKVWLLCLVSIQKTSSPRYTPTTPRPTRLRGLVVASEGPKLICHEEKVVVVFHHPPKHQETKEFDCWALHHFVHVTEEGDESGLFSLTNSTSENNSEEAQGAQ